MNTLTHTVPTLALAALLGACGSLSMSQPMTQSMTPAMKPAFSQANLPMAVQVPQGHTVALETIGIGEITYECREKANAASQHEWVFVGPNATLQDRAGKSIGRYFGPPATWAHGDGSALTGTQLAVAPAAADSIPLQLVKANPATGMGSLAGVTHIQRVATQGGVAPAATCDTMAKGRREIVKYQADYIFWKPA